MPMLPLPTSNRLAVDLATPRARLSKLDLALRGLDALLGESDALEDSRMLGKVTPPTSCPTRSPMRTDWTGRSMESSFSTFGVDSRPPKVPPRRTSSLRRPANSSQDSGTTAGFVALEIDQAGVASSTMRGGVDDCDSA